MGFAEFRKQVTNETLGEAIFQVDSKLDARLKEKGYGGFSSGHEILGALQEELSEYEDAVRYKQGKTSQEEELKDIAVGAVFALACLMDETTEW